jgi:plastocyanin
MRVLKGVVLASMLVGSGAGIAVHAHASPAAKKVTVKAVSMSAGFAFSPTKKRVKVGTTVVWSNSTSAPHTVTSDTAKWSFDKSLSTGKTVKFTFHKAGTYKFHCSIHPSMVGTIVVKK